MSVLDNTYLKNLKAIIELNSRLTSSYGDSKSMLVSILESIMNIVQCESSSLLLVKKEDDSLHFEVALGPKGAEIYGFVVDKNSIAGWVAEHSKSLIINDVINDPRFNTKVQDKTSYITRNMIAIPMLINNECVGVIELINKFGNEDFTEEDLTILELLGQQAAIAYQNSTAYIQSQEQISILQNTVNAGKDYHAFIAKNSVILSLLKNIDAASSTNSSVLITGESGVGKELFAEQVHLRSSRKLKPFVRVSCAALNPFLLESELFGHVKGAFTDAISDRKGRFEMANGGTIFLDEIGELPLNLQVKLLRVIQEKKFERVGSSKTISVDIRIISATNRNLEEMVNEGTFRRDLFFRLNVLPLNIPPLKERKDELECFSDFFLKKFKLELHKEFKGFSDSAIKAIYNYSWPGNIRELENTIERACIIGKSPFIEACDLRLPSLLDKNDCYDYKSISSSYLDLEDRSLKNALNEFKRDYIEQILEECNGNQTQAAKILDVQRTYISKLINELGIKK